MHGFNYTVDLISSRRYFYVKPTGYNSRLNHKQSSWNMVNYLSMIKDIYEKWIKGRTWLVIKLVYRPLCY